jgi:hypothetical protein
MVAANRILLGIGDECLRIEMRLSGKDAERVV